MKFQGKITNWNDKKGFGFVVPHGSDDRAFVHIKAFNSRSHRPQNGDVIRYQLVRDQSNRLHAENISFIYTADSTSKKTSRTKHSQTSGGIFTFSICLVIGFTTLMGQLPPSIAGLYAAMSLITFVSYAIDKSAAKKGRWRTQESTLHILALLGGWLGAYFAQSLLRHKSKKVAFRRVFWFTVLLNLLMLYWFYTDSSKHVINSLNTFFNS